MGYAACLGDNRKAYRVVLGKIRGKIETEKPRYKRD
jgi:hypothetical protein